MYTCINYKINIQTYISNYGFNIICKNKSAKWHCGRHTIICKKKIIKKNLINHDIWMICVSGFREKDLRIWKMHKITNNSIKNRGSNLMGSTKETSTPNLQQIRASV